MTSTFPLCSIHTGSVTENFGAHSWTRRGSLTVRIEQKRSKESWDNEADRGAQICLERVRQQTFSGMNALISKRMQRTAALGVEGLTWF